MFDDFDLQRQYEEELDEYYNYCMQQEYYDYCMQQEYEEYLKELDKEYEKEMKEDAFGTDYF